MVARSTPKARQCRCFIEQRTSANGALHVAVQNGRWFDNGECSSRLPTAASLKVEVPD
jgi:hypothetical protein